MLANEHLVIASIGDCRGVLSRLVENGQAQHLHLSKQVEWNELDMEDHGVTGERCFWREVAEVHSPSREDEKARIERAGGWTTTEKEIPISQLQRMDFCDEDVISILKRCFQDRLNNRNGSKACSSAPQRILHISRVCGELAVSRAIGDRDFKAVCNAPARHDGDDDRWETSLFLSYPDDHSRQFVGDLVSGKPDFQAIRVGEAGLQGEFLLLACDGLWDVIDMDDAVRVTRDLLFEKNRPAKQAVRPGLFVDILARFGFISYIYLCVLVFLLS
jgi:serine/threonine protein phosphatase PrpC